MQLLSQYFVQNRPFLLYRLKNITRLIVGLLRIGQVIFLSPLQLCIGGLQKIAFS
jgi:hypothetical protein